MPNYFWQVEAQSALALFVMMTGLWLYSLKIKDASIVDSFWGLTFVLQAVVFCVVAPELTSRMLVLMVLVGVWGCRLSWHIHSRNHGQGEDYRYKAMREEHGEAKFWWYSYISVFLLQGALSFVVAAPLAFVAASAGPELGLIDVLGVLSWGLGFFYEAVGDHQLKQFKKDPENKGKLLTSGLWATSRHPNYFGDACQWWGYYVIALPVSMGWLSFYGPLAMSLFIYNISGVKLLEKDLSKKKPGYQEYVENTPAFIPNLKKLFDS